MQEQFPLNSEDFEIHIQKKCHKRKVDELPPREQKKDENATGTTTNSLFETKNDKNANVDQESKQQLEIALNNNYIESTHEAKYEGNTLNLGIASKLDDAFKIEILQNAIITKMIEFTTRTDERNQYEKQILNILNERLKRYDSNLKIMKFGSASYGFGGSVNLNFLVDTGSSN